MRVLVFAALLSLNSLVLAQDNPVVVIETSEGTIKIELRPDLTPITVENFLRYVDNGLYNGLIFHRVISGFMIQGGGFTPDMNQLSTYEPIKNEADTGLPNDRGTIAMARTSVVDSATSQFFINHANNASLNHRNTSSSGYGYTSFGTVIEGLAVVDAIAEVTTSSQRGYQNVPVEPVIIVSIARE